MEQNPLQPAQPGTTPPKNWLVESILVTVFCCFVAGIPAIIFAAQVNSKWAEGNYEAARKASRDAALWTKISFFLALIFYVIGLVLFFVFGVSFWKMHQNGY